MELGGMQHPYLFLSSSVQPATLINKLGPWLQKTKQGMWLASYPWSKKPYVWDGFLTQLLNMIWGNSDGKSHRLRGSKWHSASAISKMAFGPKQHIPNPIQKQHMEVDNNTCLPQQASIQRIYASDARTFPLGIKMRLVPEQQALINLDAHNKAIQLQNHQANFLARTKTNQIHTDSLNHSQTPLQVYNMLRAMTLAHWPTTKVSQPLFHAISPMAKKD